MTTLVEVPSTPPPEARELALRLVQGARIIELALLELADGAVLAALPPELAAQRLRILDALSRMAALDAKLVGQALAAWWVGFDDVATHYRRLADRAAKQVLEAYTTPAERRSTFRVLRGGAN